MISNLSVKQSFQGNGATVNFAIPFADSYQNVSEVFVYKRDETNPLIPIISLAQEGALLDYTLTGATPPTTPLPTTVTFNVAPTSATKIFVVRGLPLTQPTQLHPASGINQLSLEKGLDRLDLLIQQVDEKASRGIRIGQTEPNSNLVLPVKVPGGVIGWKPDGSGLRYFTADEFVSSSAGVLILNLPTDGKFGGPGSGSTGTAGSVTGVDKNDYIHDAFDKVENIFEKLAPAKPANLSAVPLVITGSYGALESGTGSLHSVVTDNASPMVTASTPFYDGDQGTLTANMDSTSVGSRTLSTASDVGAYGGLQITVDNDPWAGVAGKEGFWKQLQARINTSLLTVGLHTAQLTHSTTGTSNLAFYVDNPGTPTNTTNTATGSGTGRYVSGVPSLATGDTLTSNSTWSGVVGSHYNSTRIISADSTLATGAVNAPLPGTPPASGASVTASIPLTVGGGRYSANASISVTGYNSKNGTTVANLNTGVRVDTISTESARSKSGTGQFPTKGSGAAQFGDAYASADSLVGNKELQLIGGLYQYPPSVSYTGNLPVAGPDYTGITPDAFGSYRWVTFNIGSKTAVSSVTFNFSGATNFGGAALVSGLYLQLLVEGASPTTGWVDANAAYPGVGSPTANGDAALDVGASTATSKRVTFGTTPKTGNVWVRVGIPSGSNKTFSSISIV